MTGSAGYVGQECVRLITLHGGSVVGIDRYPDRVDGTPSTLVADLGDPNEVSDSLDRAVSRLGGLDAVVCAAAVMHQNATTDASVGVGGWLHTMQVNVDGVITLLQGSHPHLARSRGPRSAVVVGSLVAALGSASSELAYTASKGALTSACREMAIVWAKDGIRLNVVAPGPLAGGLFPVGEEDSVETQRLKRIPLRRRGSATEVANVVHFLLSDHASYITGAVIPVDGGASAAFLA